MNNISIVIPVYNEQDNIIPLYQEIIDALHKYQYEIIFVNDASTDRTVKNIEHLMKKDTNIILINHTENLGQTKAMETGFKHSLYPIIITLDADLQNDPKDIEKLLNKLNEGYDCVSGVRANRHDSFDKVIISKLAYMFRRLLINDGITDSGCTLKAYRSSVKLIKLKDGWHRFIPTILFLNGYKVTEVEVNHRERKYGESKYKLNRVYHGFLSLLDILKNEKK